MTTFNGYGRPDGTVGIRNYVAVLPSVACANGVVQAIARAVPEAVPLYHGHGCGRGGPDLELHFRTLTNIAKNPNIAAVLIVGLGCEVIKSEHLALGISVSKKPVEHFYIQNEGGSRKAAAKGIEIVKRMLADANKQKRAAFPLSEIRLGLECGGSDAFSGVTANPSVGYAVDWLVGQGGTAVLTESTEMIGTAHILARRARDKEIGDAVVARVNAAEKHTHDVLGPLASLVIAPGNMDGGMSSIMEKSLGCIVKAGSTPITQVVNYAEVPAQKGLVVMDGPGYDTESMTGVAAGGCQVMIFTTGRGNPIGYPVVPVIKVASTSQLYQKMEDDMDVNAGVILEGKSIADVGTQIRDLLLRVIEGEKTKAEVNEQMGILCMYTLTTAF